MSTTTRTTTRTIKVDHLARVEGHGGITVELDGTKVGDVRFDVFEGARLLEGLVRGRSYRDVSQIVSRICAICSSAHALTSIKATEDAFGVQVSAQTHQLRDLLYRGESIESHALHLYFLAVPDYLDLPAATELIPANTEAVQMGLRLKKLGNTIQEVIGGRAVHPVNAIVGGFGSAPTESQLISLRADLLRGMRDASATIDLLATLPPADYCDVETQFASLVSPGDFGYYAGTEMAVISGGVKTVVPSSEYRSVTQERSMGHSHAKHSHFQGQPFMVGSLARLLIHPEKMSPLARSAMETLGLGLPSRNPMDNNKAQAVELVFDIEYALQAVEELLESPPVTQAPVEVKPRAGTGTGMTEAPRGTLVHSYTYDDAGRVLAADVITPTAMNAASVERHFRVAAEQAIAAGIDDDRELRKRLEMISRAYDPCISCSVHLMRK